MSDFLLKKWYLDAADYQGNVFIGYCLSLRWKKLTLHGYQLLQHSLKNGVKTKGGFTKEILPIYKNSNQLIWQPKSLQAAWISSANSLNEVLFNSEQGRIKWQCLQPKAKAKIELPEFSFTGWGYTELIEITIPVWKLPFKSLYWGRCHTDNHYLVWIKWEGNTNQNLVWHNGKRSNNIVITDKEIRGSNFRLKLGKNIPLRQGALINTILKPFRKITKLFPEVTFLAEENKWYNQGLLETNLATEPATIIYEKVLW